MSKSVLSLVDIGSVFVRIGASSFGGWPTTALLIEKEFVAARKVLTSDQLKGGVAYAQILPGATQVSIVANTGYQLRGLSGALTATLSYLLPAISLIVLFAIVYFHFASHDTAILSKLDGVMAALVGIILANAYKIGSKHVTHRVLWLFAGLALVAKLWLDVNALLLIIVFGVAGLLWSWVATGRRT